MFAACGCGCRWCNRRRLVSQTVSVKDFELDILPNICVCLFDEAGVPVCCVVSLQRLAELAAELDGRATELEQSLAQQVRYGTLQRTKLLPPKVPPPAKNQVNKRNATRNKHAFTPPGPLSCPCF